MLSPKRLNPFAKSVAKITNAELSKPLIELTTPKKLFFPTFSTRGEIVFWLSYVLFFSIFGLAVSGVFLKSLWEAWAFFLDLFLTFSWIIFLNVGYAHVKQDYLQYKSRKQIFLFVIRNVIFLTPIATVLSAISKYILIGVPTPYSDLVEFVIVNTLITVAVTSIFILYFINQYDRIRESQEHFEQQLIEQNEQLKARITPHFFFNMLNTMQFLIETDTLAAEDLVVDVSKLYRASFDETREIALVDEIEICKHYLNIEKYRFNQRLNVYWELPDEDLLYDMVISSMSLQLVIERMIVQVVEFTIETVNLIIHIDWFDDIVAIDVSVNIPKQSQGTIIENIDKNLSFINQIAMLQQYYGKPATIYHDYNTEELVTHIRYPLKDVA